VVERAGSVDISFNAISIEDLQLIPLVGMTVLQPDPQAEEELQVDSADCEAA